MFLDCSVKTGDNVPCRWKWCNMLEQMHTIYCILQIVQLLKWNKKKMVSTRNASHQRISCTLKSKNLEHISLYISLCLVLIFRNFIKVYMQYYSQCWNNKNINVSENSSPDDKFRFVLEASRRSNMTCLQLYTKEIEASPGDSAASSIFSRHLNGQGGISSASGEFQVASFSLCNVSSLYRLSALRQQLFRFGFRMW